MEKTDSSNRHVLERGLGIMISCNLKSENQISNAVAKATIALNILRKTFKCWTPTIFKTIYTTFVRTHLKCAAVAWSPHLRRDITAIENVQRKATKLVKQFKNFDYSERLVKLNLASLEDRRTEGDLIQFFKCYTGTNIVNWHIAPSLKVKGRTRRSSIQHSFVWPLPATCQLREHFFTYRVTMPWNALPQEIVQSLSVNQFKNRLDKYRPKEKPTMDEFQWLGRIDTRE